MRHHLELPYSSFLADWNSLQKSDYLTIASEMKCQIQGYFPNSETVSLVFSVHGGCNSDYSFDEFEKHFSNSLTYNRLSITAHVQEGTFLLSFHNGENTRRNQFISVFSDQHTVAQIEDILQNFLGFLIPLFESKNKNEHIQSATVLNHDQAAKGEIQSDVTAPPNHKAPFYYTGWFWGGASVVTMFIIAILQKLNIL